MRAGDRSLLCFRILATLILGLLGIGLVQGCNNSGNQSGFVNRQIEDDAPPDPPEVQAGERLFLETRFAQFFKVYLDQGGKVNTPLPNGDPVMETTVTTAQPLPGPFAGTSMNCRACHLVDEQLSASGGGMRTYADFARRSPIPDRGDGKVTTPRNSPPLVNATLTRSSPFLLHFDAEFVSTVDLIAATYTGRNFGWLPGEAQTAISHIARIIREDNGQGDLAAQFGRVSYRTLLAGAVPNIPTDRQLPNDFRIDVTTASDDAIFDVVQRLVAAYTENLIFGQDDKGNFNLSPFDVFLRTNGLPQKPAANESDIDYSRRLLQAVKTREQSGGLLFVVWNPATQNGKFKFHNQDFRFGPSEIQGLKIFLTEPAIVPIPPSELAQGMIGNCVACHAAPNFTDFKLHNTGTTQTEYDNIHGGGKFVLLSIPDLATRNADPDKYLPATAQHPNALEPFRRPPIASDSALTDIGVWNIFANSDFPLPQDSIRSILCEQQPPGCVPDSVLLPLTIARFKTPGLRDLGHSAPYMHTGQFDTLESIIGFYRNVSNLARAGMLRNADPEIAKIALISADMASLVDFMKSLNEDYE